MLFGGCVCVILACCSLGEIDLVFLYEKFVVNFTMKQTDNYITSVMRLCNKMNKHYATF